MARILVIDDDPVVADIATHFLADAGHEVRVVLDSVRGLDVFRDLHPQVVITDILMPDRGGLDIIIMLRLLDPSVPIIVISRSQRHLDYARQLSAAAVLLKPLDFPRLVATVDELLRHSASIE